MRLFIVEDSAEVMQRYQTHIAELEGVQLVGQASTVRQAVADLPSRRPHVVILDFRLPDGNCLQVLDQLRHSMPNTTFMVATNHACEEYRQYSMSAGARFFFDKSTEVAEMFYIIAALARAVNSRPPDPTQAEVQEREQQHE